MIEKREAKVFLRVPSTYWLFRIKWGITLFTTERTENTEIFKGFSL